MNILLGLTQLAMKFNFPINDCTSFLTTLLFNKQAITKAKISVSLAGVKSFSPYQTRHQEKTSWNMGGKLFQAIPLNHNCLAPVVKSEMNYQLCLDSQRGKIVQIINDFNTELFNNIRDCICDSLTNISR